MFDHITFRSHRRNVYRGAATRRTIARAAMAILAAMCSAGAIAQMTVSPSGTPSVSQVFQVPPGRGGLAPTVGLTYSAGALNGAEGNGWGLMGISAITRCPAIRATDGTTGTVLFGITDKLCLDGQRLIQTDESGSASAVSNAVGVGVATQTNDAQGLASGGYREFRTETDTYVRVRAYGYADGTNASSGPAWFRVWTKDNHVVDYGTGPSADSNTKALVMPYGKTVGMVWAMSRMADIFGNFIDYKYEQRDTAFGTVPSGCSPACTANGHEWNLLEIQYSSNKVVFNYSDRVARSPEDRAEAWQNGSKNVSVRRLDSVVTYINSPNTTVLGPDASAVATKAFKLTYDNGPITGRSRLTSWQSCAGSALSSRCLPAAKLSYAPGANDAFVSNSSFTSDALARKVLITTGGSSGALTGDFNGDGLTDVLYWSNTTTDNALFLSNGDGTFTQVPNGSGKGQFNLTDLHLFYRASATAASDGCYMSIVVDLNGDGRADIVRWANGGIGAYGESCPTAESSYLLISNGDGSFARQAVNLGDRRSPLPQGNCVGGYSNCSTSGANFYLGDFDGDGITDLITVSFSYVGIPLSGNVLHCLSAPGTCSTVFTPGKGDGTFDTTRTQTLESSDITLFAPPSADGLRVMDFNGDGRADLELQSADLTNGLYNGGVYVSNIDATGKLSFSQAGQFPKCSIRWHTNATRNELVDFNGDGRNDYLCANSDLTQNQLYVSMGSANGVSMLPITPTTLAGRVSFNSTGQDLVASSAMPGATFTVADFNGDGRSDILRVANDPTKNTLYLSNGDGSFSASTTLSFDSSTAALTNSDGSVDFATGDFTGNGNVEILRMQTVGGVASNRLYVKSDPTQPDLLRTFTSPTGQTTQLYHVALNHSTPSNGVSGAYGPRYTSDVGTINAASGRTTDVNQPIWVIATAVSDSGVGSQTLATEYSYAGYKQDLDGRGNLGFRDVKRQSLSPIGNAITTDTTYLQQFPYIGMTATTSTVLSTLTATSGKPVLSGKRSVWCDQTAAAGADSTAIASGVPCPSTSKIRRPYDLWDQQTANDLGDQQAASYSLPSTTTQTAVNASADPVTIIETRTMTGGANDTFTTTVKNDYFADSTSCTDTQTCAWILSRTKQTTTEKSVPSALPTTSAGTDQNATAIQGTGPTSFLSLSISPLGAVAVGSSQTGVATLTNSGASPQTVTAPTAASVTGAGFTFVSTTCSGSVAAFGSCTVTIKFSPTAVAPYTGVLSVSTGLGTQRANLSGTGSGAIATLTSATTQTVPTVWYGSAAQTLTTSYRNDGNAPMTLASPSLAAPLSIASNNCTSVAVGASCSMVIGAATNVPGLSQSQTFAPTGAVTAPAATTVSWTTLTAVPHWSPTSLSFGNVEDGTTASQNITLINDGNWPYNWAANNSIANAPSNFSFNTSACSNVVSGGSCNVVVTFTPAGYAGYAGSNITMTAASFNTNTFSVSGIALYAPSLVASPSSFSGTSVSPSPVTTSIAISNTGMWPTTLTLSMTGGASVAPTSLSCPATGSCGSVTVTTPTVAGNYSGTLSGTSSAGGSVSSVPMTMTVTPATVAFTVVSTNGLSTTFKNPNAIAVTPSSSGISSTDSGIFSHVSTNTCTGSIAAGATCSISIVAGNPDCADNNYTAHSYVTTAAGTAVGSTVTRTSTGVCR